MSSRDDGVLGWFRDLRLPADERRAKRSERAAERQIRRERDNQATADRRHAATEAERHRWGTGGWTGRS